jgi:hypothetical protein
MTGFGLLNKNRLIDVVIERDRTYSPGNAGPHRLKAVINDHFKTIYDVRDSDAVALDDLEWADYYFKRSFNPKIHEDNDASQKIFRLGLNYPAYGADDFSYKYIRYGLESIKILVSSARLQKDFIERMLRSGGLLSRLSKRGTGKGVADYKKFEGQPFIAERPLIVFFARLWDPNQNALGMGDLAIQERRQINEMRSKCIYLLKEKFKDQFMGGLVPTPFAIQHHPEIVVSRKTVYKSHYLKMLHKASICISTSGLWSSNSWKLGEYVAAAKAIVAEKLRYMVPGDFLPNVNYLEFENPEQCVDRVDRLVNEPELIYKMMLNNLRYYHEHLRPDRLVWNTLRRVLGYC